MALNGKGIYLWQIKRVEGGDPSMIAYRAARANLTHVLIKVADGRFSYGYSGGTDLVPGVVAALRDKGIQPWGWQYVYGQDPLAEAKKAIDRVKSLKLAGFIVNAEGQFKAKGMEKVARTYMKELRKGLSGIPIGLSTYRYPTVHYQFPFSAFLEYCDLNLPQIYWIGSSNPAQQLKKSYDEYKRVSPWRTFVPTGAAFSSGNWSATPAQVNEFLAQARAMKLAAANFWEMGAARDNGGNLWKAIKGYNWATGTAPTPEPGSEPTPTPVPNPVPVSKPAIIDKYLAALNSRNPDKLAALYVDSAKLFVGNTRYKGRAAIKSFYANLFKYIMPKASFSFRTWSWKGYSVKISWKAVAGSKAWSGSESMSLNPSNPKMILEQYSGIPTKKSIDLSGEESPESEPGPIPV